MSFNILTAYINNWSIISSLSLVNRILPHKINFNDDTPICTLWLNLLICPSCSLKCEDQWKMESGHSEQNTKDKLVSYKNSILYQNYENSDPEYHFYTKPVYLSLL